MKTKPKTKSHAYTPDSKRIPKLQARLDQYCHEHWPRCKRTGETDGAALRRIIRAEVVRIGRKEA